MKEFVIYTDGAYDMNTHYGASAIVILDKDEKNVLYERSAARLIEPEEGGKQQYSQEQEIGACIRAIATVPEGSWVTIKSDSQYAVKVLGKEWNASANLNLIDIYFSTEKKRRVRVNFVKVKGHSALKGGPKIWGNDRADQLCTEAMARLANGGEKVFEKRYAEL